MAFDKITAEDTNGKGVVGLPDTPQLDTTSMQKKFDELATDVIIPKFNKLVDDMSGNGAAGSTGAKVPEGLVAEQNVQAVLQALHDDTQTRQSKEAGKGLSTNDYTNEEKNTVQKNTNSRHTHENKSVLDLITSSVKSGYDRVVTMLSSVKRVATEVEASDESIPTGKAIVNFVQDMGGGDMSTSKYDPDKDGKVLKADQADDTSLFAGQPPAYYAKADMVTKKYDSNATYTKGQTCIQSDKIWRAKADINTPEAWTEGHWEETSLEQIRAEMESEISSVNAKSTFHSIQYQKSVDASTTEKFYTGASIVIPANSYFSVTAVGLYANAPCRWIGISTSSAGDVTTCYRASEHTFQHASVSFSAYADKETTLYIYGQWEWAGVNEIWITGYYVTQ